MKLGSYRVHFIALGLFSALQIAHPATKEGCENEGYAWNPESKSCCPVGQVYSNATYPQYPASGKAGYGGCCPQGQLYDSTTSYCCAQTQFNPNTKTCCPLSKPTFSNPTDANGKGGCCPSGQVYDQSGTCCPSYSYNLDNNSCCPSGSVFVAAAKTCCPADKPTFSNPTNVEGKGGCCPAGQVYDQKGTCCPESAYNPNNTICCASGNTFIASTNTCCPNSQVNRANNTCCPEGKTFARLPGDVIGNDDPRQGGCCPPNSYYMPGFNVCCQKTDYDAYTSRCKPGKAMPL